jgi:O-antigen/teichoic acid export membrane protein
MRSIENWFVTDVTEVRDTFVPLFGTGVVKALGILTTAIIFHGFSKEETGFFFMLTGLLGYGVALVAFGLNPALISRAAEGISDELLNSAMVLRLLVAAVAFLTLFAASMPLRRNPADYALFALLYASLLASALSLDWLMLAKGGFVSLTLIQVLAQLVYLSIVWLAGRSASLVLLALAQFSVSFSLSAGIFLRLLYVCKTEVIGLFKSAASKMSKGLLGSWKLAGRYWTFCALMFITGNLVNLELVVGGWFLEDSELGNLAAATRLFLVAFSFMIVLNQVIYARLVRVERGRVHVLGWNLLVAGPMLFVILVMTEQLVKIVFGTAYLPFTAQIRAYSIGLLPASYYFVELNVFYLKLSRSAVTDSLLPVLAVILAFPALILLGIAFAQWGLWGMIAFGVVKWLIVGAILRAGTALLSRRLPALKLHDLVGPSTIHASSTMAQGSY